MSVGKIGEFDVRNDNWTLYAERLEQYLVVNKVEDALKVPTLITVIGNEAYELLVNLCIPDRPATKTYTHLIECMRAHLQPRPSVLAERYKFRLKRQGQDESVAKYVEELKKLSRYCEFGGGLDESMRDQFVCGIHSEQIRQRLFAEEKLSFGQAYKLAATMEAAEKDAAETGGQQRRGGEEATAGCHKVTSVGRYPRADRSAANNDNSAGAHRGRALVQRGSAHAHASSTVKQQQQTSSWSGRGGARGPCGACGAAHKQSECKFQTYTCRKCLRVGHLQRVCERSADAHSRRAFANHHLVKEAEAGESTDSSEEVRCSPLFHIDLRRCKPIRLALLVEGKRVDFEVDTGSAVTCVSADYYERMFAHLPLQPCGLRLKYYTGETVTPQGLITTEVQYKNVKTTLELYVVNCGKVNLLGRQWLSCLKIEIPVINYHNVNVSCEEGEFNLKKFSSRYHDVFAEGLGRYTGGPVKLYIRAGAVPVYMRARPLPYALKDKVERELDTLVSSGVLTPVETSDWATPIVPVIKKTGDIRICADYKITLNKVLEVDRFPVPRVDDVLAKLQGGVRFTKIDLSQAYAQFELEEQSKKYTVINTQKGLYRYNRLVYGLSSSPGIFQRKLEQIFSDMPNVGTFLDDIIITGKDEKEHKETLHKVFERLSKNGLRVRKEKCSFFQKAVSYLGYTVSEKGIHTCPDKVQCIKDTPAPTNVSELRAFLGLVMYYAKFVHNISTVLYPLYQLLKKDSKFIWSEACQDAINHIKRLLVSCDILAHYSPAQELVLTTDASSVGVAAVISNITPDGERPVAYASRTLNTAERGYSQIDKEALAIVFGVRKFHQYLYGRKFVLKTDHKALVSIFGTKAGIPVMAASRLQRWAVLLAGYNYTVEYVKSKLNCADALSRLPAVIKKDSQAKENSYINFVEEALPLRHTDIREATGQDRILTIIYSYLRSGWPPSCSEEELKPYFVRQNELYLDSGCIMWGYRMVIPERHREHILKELHNGHMGIVKTKSLARSYVWWPGIDGDVERACKQCVVCNAEADAPARSAPQPWSYPPNPWTRLHIDFFGPYKGRKFLLIIDATTKWIEVFEMKTTSAGSVINKLRETFARFGICAEIVSDNGPPFTSTELSIFFKRNGIKHTLTPAYHQSSNGAAENAVKLCKRAIKKADREKLDLHTALQNYLLAYRNAEHSTTGSSPASLLQRRRLRSRLDLLQEDRAGRVRDVQKRQVEAAGGANRGLQVGEDVYMREYSTGNKWEAGEVIKKLGTRNYVVRRESGHTDKRHIDQLRRRARYSNLTLPESPPCVNSGAEESSLIADQSVTQPAPPSPRAAPESVPTPTRLPGPEPGCPSPTPATPVAARVRPMRLRRPVKRFGLDID